MKHRSTQLDVRKNPDSPGVHGLRLAVNSSSLGSESQTGNSSESKPSPSAERFGLPFASSTEPHQVILERKIGAAATPVFTRLF
jgi:hypothetical protein